MHPNVQMLSTVARQLGALCEQCIFVGGATVPLYLTALHASSARPTKDVDIIVEIATRVEYYRFADQLRELGFREDVEATILCRWKWGELIVDVMPTEFNVLGFSNRWYGEVIHNAQWREITDGIQIQLATTPYFIATKIEAFNGRGHNDFLASRDMEDIVAILNGREELLAEARNAPASLRLYLAEQFEIWLQDRDFMDALPGHILPDPASQARLPSILNRIRSIAALK
jgi:predicted nucleotidyltransferase